MTRTSDERLDLQMVARALVPSRARAQDLIRRGLVTVGGVVTRRPGATTPPDAEIAIAAGEGRYVSRGALKLVAALDGFGLSPAGLTALDVGASTGGFTEVLLERGALRVYAVDVGHGQLDRRLAADPRVVSLERFDARALDRSLVPEPIGFVTADVSFVSLTLVLAPALALAAPGACLVALIKPQFEAGREAVGKGGIVRRPEDRARAVARVADWIARQDSWHLIGTMDSPITGGSGNRETLLAARHAG